MRWALLSLFAFSLFPSLHAAEPTLRWAADSEGGAPFVFQDARDPEKVIGFEVDLAAALARRMGMKSQFVQNQWDGLIPGLNRGTYDVAINGVEITEDRRMEVLFSDPYFITHTSITVRKDNTDIQTLSDCVGKSVGTLKASLAERILEAKGGIDVRGYESEANAYQDLEYGRIDAVLLDTPIAIYHGKHKAKLKVLSEPVGSMTYGVVMKKSDLTLAKKVNQALADMKQSGELRDIYESWGLWNSKMEESFGPGPDGRNYSDSKYQAYLEVNGLKKTWRDRLSLYWSFFPLLGKGALVTLALSLTSMVLAVMLGLGLTLIRLYTPQPFSGLATFYIEAIRGTPLLIQLYFIFYGLPNIGIKLEPFVAAVLGLGLNYAAYEAENYRAGLQSIPKGQYEASYALGMTQFQTLIHIIIPQSFRLVIPPITNDFISLLKDSSLVSVITMVELTKIYGQLATTYYDYFGLGLMVAVFYFCIGLPFVKLAQLAEAKLYRERVPLGRQSERVGTRRLKSLLSYGK